MVLKVDLAIFSEELIYPPEFSRSKKKGAGRTHTQLACDLTASPVGDILIIVKIRCIRRMTDASTMISDTVETMENQFDLEITETGHEVPADENGGVRKEIFLVQGIIKTPINNLHYDTMLLVKADTREDPMTVRGKLRITFDEEKEYSMIYSHKKDKWSEPT